MCLNVLIIYLGCKLKEAPLQRGKMKTWMAYWSLQCVSANWPRQQTHIHTVRFCWHQLIDTTGQRKPCFWFGLIKYSCSRAMKEQPFSAALSHNERLHNVKPRLATFNRAAAFIWQGILQHLYANRRLLVYQRYKRYSGWRTIKDNIVKVIQHTLLHNLPLFPEYRPLTAKMEPNKKSIPGEVP